MLDCFLSATFVQMLDKVEKPTTGPTGMTDERRVIEGKRRSVFALVQRAGHPTAGGGEARAAQDVTY